MKVLHRATAPVIVPSTGAAGLALLAGFLFLLAAVALRRSSGFFSTLFATVIFVSSGMARAQENGVHVFVEISHESGAPAPEQVVDDFDLGSGLPPPIAALAVESPSFIEYFIPREYRAQGDFRDYLENNPDLPRARLEKTIIVQYPATSSLDNALAALRADPYVRHAGIPETLELSVVADRIPGRRGRQGGVAMEKNAATQYWIDAMNFDGAWSRAGGWGRVGVIDNGLSTSHADLRSQNPSGALTGGNFLPHMAIDLGRQGTGTPIDFDVDEMEPVAITNPAQNACDPQGSGFFTPSYAGHGAHVHGLIAANHSNADGTVGACKNCGISSVKVLRAVCSIVSGQAVPEINEAAVWAGLTLLSDTGAQVVNMSLGGAFAQNFCAIPANFNKPECLAIAHAHSKGILMVAASGNSRRKINFPASDPRVVSVGGLDETLEFWNEDKDPTPYHLDECPYC